MKRPLSMTAFGRGEATADNRTWTAEIRSVNHRFFDPKIRIPNKYAGLEERIKKEVMNFYSRAHVDITIGVSGDQSEALKLQVNLPLAKQFLHCLQELKANLSLAENPNLSMIASYRDVISTIDQEENLDELWPTVQQALAGALTSSREMREKEGTHLKNDLLARLDAFDKTLRQIEGSIPEILKTKEATLKERLNNLLSGIELDPTRLAQEVAIIADKADVTEEIVRLNSHIKQFNNFLEIDEPTGRRMDFMMQEFLREVNTLASKISSAEVAHQTVDLKNEIEKMREQVQNLE
ncbi:MAG: YicC family protein [Proteobacteria bacterium]|nr:YicC family protein [Pseudomonadota bacterium]MBU1714491.1 YicC family protein [Pseudomonadota bacterium]